MPIDPGKGRGAKRTFPAAFPASFAAPLAVAVAVLLSAPAAHPAPRSDPGRGSPLPYLAQLYQGGRFFELRDVLAQMDDNPMPGLDFYRGVVDESFNRLNSAVLHFLRYLARPAADRPPALAKEAWALLASAYRRSGQYRKSAEAQRQLLNRYGAKLEADERASLESQYLLWSSLADVPPQTVEISGDSVIRMENRNVPVGINGRTLYLLPDTGSSLSVLVQSAAEELGLARFGPSVKIQSATGRWVDARAAVVPEMRLGEAVIRNAVFLVFPDDIFAEGRLSGETWRHGLIGAPVLAALREITETADGRFLIPASPRPGPFQNMCFFGFTPIVEVVHRKSRLPFILDTGSSATFLNPPYFNRFRGEIKARTRARKGKVRGIGSSRMIPMYILFEFDFRTGGLALGLRRVLVHTKATYSGSTVFFGTLGLDVLGQCSRMTLNFESMSFVLR